MPLSCAADGAYLGFPSLAALTLLFLPLPGLGQVQQATNYKQLRKGANEGTLRRRGTSFARDIFIEKKCFPV